MKKFARITALLLVVIMSVALLASCGVSEKTAEKINKAHSDGEDMSIADVKKLCGGDATYDYVGKVTNTGIMVWVSGCKNDDDVKAKKDAGKSLKALYVTFAGGKATGASYQEYDENKKS